MRLGLYFFLFYPILVIFLLLQFSLNFAHSCGSRTGLVKRLKKPLYFKQRVPDVEEISLGASGKPQGKITRNSSKFNSRLVACYSTDIVFKDEERTGADRIMSKRCRDKLKILASKVKKKWRGIKLRVTEAWDEDGSHSENSLHYEGRAVDITTSDKDLEKYPELGSLAVEAGFDWVYYEQKHRIHASVRADDSKGYQSETWGSCFHSHASVTLENGATIPIEDLNTGQKVLAMDENGKSSYSEVLLFLDFNPWRKKVPFTVIETERPSKRLSLTKNHLVFVMANNATKATVNAKLARLVKPGEFVLVSYKGGLMASKVKSVVVEEKDGVVAPLTQQGTIVVDGVAASCYSEVTSHTIAHLAFSPVRFLRYYAPSFLRRWDMSGSQKGTHWFPEFLISLNRMLGVAEFA